MTETENEREEAKIEVETRIETLIGQGVNHRRKRSTTIRMSMILIRLSRWKY